MKLPITVCILFKNDADRLVRTLRSLDVFEEIIAADTGSQDESPSICRQFGAQVASLPWLGFGATRRRLFRLAKQPWILWIDTDEVLTEELRDELLQLFARGEPDGNAYSVNRKMNFLGRWVLHGNWFPDRNIRLFRRDVWEMDDALVHEKVTVSCPVGRLHGLLEHYSYRDREDYRNRMEWYADLWAKQRFQEGKRSSRGRVLWHGFWAFARGYFLKKGFLDGLLGLEVASLNGWAAARKYSRLRKMTQQVATQDH
ncbi:MAG: glycosyltransferase family 2 protein [Planctomycetales bacterium]